MKQISLFVALVMLFVACDDRIYYWREHFTRGVPVFVSKQQNHQMIECNHPWWGNFCRASAMN